MDSLDIVELIMALEEEFDTNPDEEAEKISTVGDVIDYIRAIHRAKPWFEPSVLEGSNT